MRIHRIVSIALVLMLAAGVATAVADETPAANSPEGVDRFSLGIIVGHPTGLSGKLWLTPTSAVDAAIAWNFQAERFHLHASYLHHFFDAFDISPDRLPLYLGIGGNFRVRGDDPGDTGAIRSGLRVPFGISFLSAELPLEGFAEIVPGLRIIPSTEFELWWGIGARYRF